MTTTPSYKPRNFPLSGLTGISDKTLEMHFGLYEGYVNETNLLTERLAELDRDGKAAKNSAYAEMKRHLSYEYGGMILHEYYFDNLAPKGKGKPSSELTQAFEQSFGGLGAGRDDFVATGGMRGVGWAVVFRDPATGRLFEPVDHPPRAGGSGGIRADPRDGRVGALRERQLAGGRRAPASGEPDGQVKIRVEAKDHEIVNIELSGEWRAEPVDLHCLVGPTVVHYFTPEGFYDRAEHGPRRPQ